MKRTTPDPGAVATALMARLEQAETRLTAVEELRHDIAALGRGLADVVAQVRALSDHTNRRIVSMPNQRPGSGDPDGDAQAETEGEDAGEQPNWLTVTDPGAAARWLTDAVAFAADILAPLGQAPTPGCWVLHPASVVEVIGLQQQYRTAYLAEDPTAVSELLSRWLPGAAARVSKDLASCQSERAHRCSAGLFEIPSLDPMRVAAWWVDTRGVAPDAVEAFALTRIR